MDNRRSTEVMHVLLATDLTHAPLPPDAEEDIESVWHTEAEIDALVREGGIVHAHALASWCLYRARA